MRNKPIILVVDDAPVNVKVLTAALRQDYIIKVAVNGLDALASAKSEPYPDLILLDVMMPEMDGYEVLRLLKENPATSRIPVIFVTAKASAIDEEAGLNLGAIDYITKPISIPVTRARVRNHVALKLQADLLEELSLIDPLTQIPNRRQMDENLENEWKKALRSGKPLSILMIDIDYFKGYNDHYGHGAGDECLCRVAEALSNGVSRSGDMVARYGGEEFAVILPETDLQSALLIAERLRQLVLGLNLPHAASRLEMRVTVSIGCATMDSATGITKAAELLQKADSMLYQAKKMGRNQVYAG
ncbi:MAG: diguanylate cyclase response regulator [Candidatus Methylumidiphilus alinenensis]|uniref:diguanylate cyclase n=1 Tax=Candidatus Methylumidiphilus alinenensis TaxID=2202197 RepID=A0A2W4R0W9_9GAMM|nr:MAG: diguanylate cyclase response regulator [Candidatus Methylumidiphilus alinenensis]